MRYLFLTLVFLTACSSGPVCEPNDRKCEARREADRKEQKEYWRGWNRGWNRLF